MPTLLVIDAQQDRLNALHHSKRRRILRNILDEVSIATINGDGIIFTTISKERPHPDLTSLVKGYHRVSFIHKDGEDGAAEIARIISSRRFAKGYVRALGLYTLGSIRETLTSLSAEMENSLIEIAAGSCVDLKTKSDCDFDWSWDLENIRISNSGRCVRSKR